MIVLEAAYHGNTNALIDISPYKHAGPGGNGAPDWVHVVPIPDVYRGIYKRSDPQAGEKYAARTCATSSSACGRRPPGRRLHRRDLSERRRADHAARPATSRRSIATFAPPAASASPTKCRRASAASARISGRFEAAGRRARHRRHGQADGQRASARRRRHDAGDRRLVRQRHGVLQHLRRQHRLLRGRPGGAAKCCATKACRPTRCASAQQLLQGLRPFDGRYPLIGDVRGSGLFLGVELVRDRATLEPATAEASIVVNRMREYGILARHRRPASQRHQDPPADAIFGGERGVIGGDAGESVRGGVWGVMRTIANGVGLPISLSSHPSYVPQNYEIWFVCK